MLQHHIQMEQSKSPRQLSPSRAYPRYKEFKDFHDSADDGSTASISEPDHGYTTEPTTPSTSASCVAEDTDEAEGFKDREYPQRRGKTYLDQGGTTVRGPMQGVMMCIGIWY